MKTIFDELFYTMDAFSKYIDSIKVSDLKEEAAVCDKCNCANCKCESDNCGTKPVKVTDEVRKNVDELVDKYYDDVIAPSLKAFKSLGVSDVYIKNPIKENYRNFLLWTFTQL